MTSSTEAALERTFSQLDFDRFAALSGDDNPIHVDAAFAAKSRFGRPVAHGLLLISVLRGLVERLRPGARIAHLQVMFPAPTLAGEAMHFCAAAEEDGVTIALSVRRAGSGMLTCEGQCRVRS
ncbi:MAG: MaoC/PaaZ C-terminal domain-containing protein [Lysobacterales bacterium]